MRVLFAALHHAYFRNFDSVVRELASRGHQVHLGGEEPEALGGRPLAEALAAECPGVTWDFLPSLDVEPWFDANRRLRVALDYVRALDPRYPDKLRVRAEARTARLVRWASRVPGIGASTTRRALTAFERLMPPSELMVDYLRAHAPRRGRAGFADLFSVPAARRAEGGAGAEHPGGRSHHELGPPVEQGAPARAARPHPRLERRAEAGGGRDARTARRANRSDRGPSATTSGLRGGRGSRRWSSVEPWDCGRISRSCCGCTQRSVRRRIHRNRRWC